MKKRFLKLLPVLLISSLPLSSFASPELGIIIGDPTGFSAEYKNFQAALGWNLDKSLHAHLDYLFYKNKIEIFDLYVGAGGVFVSEDTDNKADHDNDHILGVRLPLGAAYLFKEVNLNVFLEVVPTMYFIKETAFGFQWGLGVRYVF